MKLTEQVKKAVATLSPQEIKKLRDEQGVKDWDVVDLLPEQEALEALTDGIEGDELEALQAAISADPDRIGDRLSAIQQSVIASEDLSDETRTAVLERLSDTAEKVGVELHDVQQKGTPGDGTGGAARAAIQALKEAGMSNEDISKELDDIGERDGEDVTRSASVIGQIDRGEIDNPPQSLVDALESIDPPEEEEVTESTKESPQEPTADDSPSAAELLEARDHLDEKVASVKESGEATDEAIALVRESIKPRIMEGELLTAEQIAEAFDAELEGSKRAAESWRSKYETGFPTGQTGEGLERDTESMQEDALLSHI